MSIRFPLATSTWDEKEFEALQKVITSGIFSMNTEVLDFEKQFFLYYNNIAHSL